MNQRPLYIFDQREALLLASASMFLGLFISLLFQGLLSKYDDVILLGRLIIILGELAILIPPFFILRQRGLTLKQLLPVKSIKTFTWVMSVVLVVGAIGLVSIFEVLAQPLFPIPDFLRQLESDLSQGSLLETLLLLIAGSLVAPFVEEFIFRGVLQQSFFYRYGSLLPALIIPTVIFALFHVAYLFYLPALLELIFLALLLAWITVKTGNLFVPMLVHGLFNLSSFSGLFITDLEKVNTLADLGWPWIIISTLMSVAGWYYFKNTPVAIIEEVFLIPPNIKKGHSNV